MIKLNTIKETGKFGSGKWQKHVEKKKKKYEKGPQTECILRGRIVCKGFSTFHHDSKAHTSNQNTSTEIAFVEDKQ